MKLIEIVGFGEGVGGCEGEVVGLGGDIYIKSACGLGGEFVEEVWGKG